MPLPFFTFRQNTLFILTFLAVIVSIAHHAASIMGTRQQTLCALALQMAVTEAAGAAKEWSINHAF